MRKLQRRTIERCLATRLGSLRYFGLPSSSLGDVKAWSDIFAEFCAAERGESKREWELQHDLLLQAFRSGLGGKLRLYRGDIDEIIAKGKDQHKNRLKYPFDVVSLDYSGGLFYRSRGQFSRLRAIARVIEQQASLEADFVLLVSCNLDAIDQGEVRNTIENIRTQLTRYGVTAGTVIDAYLAHARDEARLKLYLPYFVNQEAAKWHYSCETHNAAFYEGNLSTRMMAFRFCLHHDPRTEAIRDPKERISQIINKPFLEITDGNEAETNLGLPKLVMPISGGES